MTVLTVQTVSGATTDTPGTGGSFAWSSAPGMGSICLLSLAVLIPDDAPFIPVVSIDQQGIIWVNVGSQNSDFNSVNGVRVTTFIGYVTSISSVDFDISFSNLDTIGCFVGIEYTGLKGSSVSETIQGTVTSTGSDLTISTGISSLTDQVTNLMYAALASEDNQNELNPLTNGFDVVTSVNIPGTPTSGRPSLTVGTYLTPGRNSYSTAGTGTISTRYSTLLSILRAEDTVNLGGNDEVILDRGYKFKTTYVEEGQKRLLTQFRSGEIV